MSDYSDLVKRLRCDGIAARDTLKCAECAPTVDPEDALEAADAIELLQRELKCANELWEQQKELALEYLADIEKANERIEELKELLMIANNDFFNIEATTFDMKSRIAELESALELAHKLYNSVNGSLDAFEHDLRMDIGNTNYNCIKERLHEFEAARKALGEEE